MRTLPPWPTGEVRAHVSPSRAADLFACPLRLAFTTANSAARWIGTPATRLGSTCHIVLEAAARGDLGTPADASWRVRFDRAWDAVISAQLAEIGQLGGAGWPAPARWPRLNIKKAWTRHLAGTLATKLQNAAKVPETTFQSADGSLRGRPDLIIRAPVHEIWEFKTGTMEDSSGNVRPEYVIQLELYAALEREASGRVPAVALVPIEGAVKRWTPLESELADRAAAVKEILAIYNQAVAAGALERLARASSGTCRWCRFAPRCPAFWAAYTADWWDDAHAIAGDITDRRDAARHDGRDDSSGTASAGCGADRRDRAR
jgi:hypothetical protein